MKKEASWYEKLDDRYVHCLLCPHDCHIPEGGSGICKVRYNQEGTLYSLNYNRITSIAIDPIEKKPLFHFHKGKYLLSLGTFGCNFKCDFCQNHQISQNICNSQTISIEQLIDTAENYPNCVGFAFTYNEPTIWYETVIEYARKAKSHGLVNTLVTNGYINDAPLRELLPYIDAMNIDVKSMEEGFYKDTCGGRLKPVIETVETCIDKCHVEITCLIIPGLNENAEDMKRLASWLSGFDPNIPLHINRYYPSYKMDISPTNPEVLIELRKIARKYLHHVYIGNVPNLDKSYLDS